MLPADQILYNAHMLCMDYAYTQYRNGAVAISGDSLLAVGGSQEILEKYSAPTKIDCQGKIMLPGLINAHTHVPMTLLRGLADDLRLDVWLLGYMMPVEKEFVSPQFVNLGTKLACAELIRSGVTTFNDMYYFEADVARGAVEAGLRAVCGQTVLKFPSPDAGSYEESLELARQFIKEWKNHPLIVPSIAPHAPYTCTEEILRACSQLAVEFDVPLHIHISETAQEVENSRKQFGIPVVPFVEQQAIFDAKVIAAHCVHIDSGEINTLNHHKAGVAHNPSSNLKLASGFAPVAQMLAAGLNVGIGTDGPASNNDLDMFEEIRLASFISKATTGDPVSIPARMALTMATRMGAQALHMGHLTGSLEPGKRADLILIDINPLHNSPRFYRDPDNAYAQLVYASKSTDVTDVMVNGQWVMQNHVIHTLDEAELIAEANEYATKIDHFLIRREQSILSKLVAINGARQEESFEVQIKSRLDKTDTAIARLDGPEIEVLYSRHYYQYDTYFIFDDPEQGFLRHREDDFIDPKGNLTTDRYRLTLIGSSPEQDLSEAPLYRSRFIAPANHSLRFYRDYFKPAQEISIEKDRLRWRVLFRGLEFFINIDRFIKPALGTFLEVKSRTWSRRDAEHKSQVASELLRFLNDEFENPVTDDYITLLGSTPS